MVAGEFLPDLSGDVDTKDKFPVFQGSIATKQVYNEISIVTFEINLPTVISKDVLVGIGTIKMIANYVEREEQWSDLHVRHKVRVVISVVLLAVGVIDLSLNLLHLPALWDTFSDILWVIGAFGLVGTAAYLAFEAKGK